MSDEKVWRGWCLWLKKKGTWEIGNFSHTPMITDSKQEISRGSRGFVKLREDGAENTKIVMLPAADYDALLDRIAELEKKDDI